MQQLAGKRKRISRRKAEGVARRYFEAIDARDLDGAVALWAAGRARERARARRRLAPEGVRGFIGELMRRDARPAHGGRLDDRPRANAAGCSGACGAPSRDPELRRRGAERQPVDLEGFDLVTVRDGLIPANDAFTDSMTFARRSG